MIEGKNNPRHIEKYINHKSVNRKIEYLLLPDPVLGAALLTKKNVTMKYLHIILGEVLYCEDYFLKFYMLDNRKLTFFNEVVLWYEYGMGVSTNEKWKTIRNDEKKRCAKLLYNYPTSTLKWKLVWRYQMRYGNLPKYRFLLFPSLLLCLISNVNKRCFEVNNESKYFLKKICFDNEGDYKHASN